MGEGQREGKFGGFFVVLVFFLNRWEYFKVLSLLTSQNREVLGLPRGKQETDIPTVVRTEE